MGDPFRHRQPTNIPWETIDKLNTSSLEDDTNILLWIPGLRVSGPAVVCCWSRSSNSWSVSFTGYTLPKEYVITHFCIIKGDPQEDLSDASSE